MAQSETQVREALAKLKKDVTTDPKAAAALKADPKATFASFGIDTEHQSRIMQESDAALGGTPLADCLFCSTCTVSLSV